MRPRTTALASFYFVSFAAMGVFLPFLSPWLEARGIRGLELALLGSARPLAGVLAPPLAGLLADLLGLRRSLLRATAIGAMLAFVGLAVFAGMDRLPFVVVALALVAFSVCRGPMSQLTDVAALESTADYGRLRLWGSLGFLVTAGVAGFAIDPSHALPFPLVIAALLLLNVVLAFRLPPSPPLPPRPVWRAARALVRAADFQLFLFATFAWLASHSAYDLLISLHLRDLGASPGVVGIAWAVGTLAEVALLFGYRPWLQRYGAPRLLLVGLTIAALRWALLALVPSTWVLLFLQPLHAGSFALVFVGALEHLRQRSAPEILATAQGLFTAAGAAGATLAMFAWAPLYAAAGGATVFAFATAVALVGVGAALALVYAPPLPVIDAAAAEP